MDDVTNAPAGRIDVVGITTVNGAQDDPFIPGNAEELNVAIGNGQCKLAVVKGAGLISTNLNREVGITIGERYQTIGQPKEEINTTAKNPDGTLTNDPRVGTYPMPDDVVNICFSRADIRNDIQENTLDAWAQRNRNASFFLPIAYVFVNDTYTLNNPIPQNWLYDIRPFFRTAELTLNERQSLAASVNPSVTNPVVTASYQETRFGEEVDRTNGLASIQQQINVFKTQVADVFNGMEGNAITTTPNTVINGSFGIVSNTKIGAAQYGVPVDATHVILWGSVIGGGDPQGDATPGGNEGQSSPRLDVQGAEGSYLLAQAIGNNENGDLSKDTGMIILKLYPGEPASIGGYFYYRSSGGYTTEVRSIFLRGYILPTSMEVSFPAPSDTTE